MSRTLRCDRICKYVKISNKILAAAALGKLTGLVFEKPGKKFFGT